MHIWLCGSSTYTSYNLAGSFRLHKFPIIVSVRQCTATVLIEYHFLKFRPHHDPGIEPQAPTRRYLLLTPQQLADIQEPRLPARHTPKYKSSLCEKSALCLSHACTQHTCTKLYEVFFFFFPKKCQNILFVDKITGSNCHYFNFSWFHFTIKHFILVIHTLMQLNAHTSADWSRKVPDSSVSRIGDAGQSCMTI